MVSLYLLRDVCGLGATVTTGSLFIWLNDFSSDYGKFRRMEKICDTLEPAGTSKYPCIPEGNYHFHLYPSPKFKRHVPLLDDVPGRKYIEIHPGNTLQDTLGCILVGTASTLKDGTPILKDSRKAFGKLMSYLCSTDLDMRIQVTSDLPF